MVVAQSRDLRRDASLFVCECTEQFIVENIQLDYLAKGASGNLLRFKLV